MRCQNCNRREAAVLFTQIVDQEKRITYLCRACADEKSGSAGGTAPASEAVSDAAGDSQQAGASLVCPKCGETFAEFQKVGLFGCAACYGAFEPELDCLLKRAHGACRHIAGAVEDGKPDSENLFFLEKQLRQAVERDAFEEAARLRDRIVILKAQVGGL